MEGNCVVPNIEKPQLICADLFHLHWDKCPLPILDVEIISRVSIPFLGGN